MFSKLRPAIKYHALRKDKMKCLRWCLTMEVTIAIFLLALCIWLPMYILSLDLHFLPCNRNCTCSDFGWDIDGWSSLGESVRLLDFAVGDELENRTVFNIGESDSYYFMTHGAIVYTVELSIDYSKFLVNEGSEVMHIYNRTSFKTNTSDLQYVCWLLEFSGLIPQGVRPYDTSECGKASAPYILKSKPEFVSLLDSGVDILHLKCDSCEFVFLFYLISSGLIRNVARLNFALNSLPGHHQLRCKLQADLFLTHVPTYCAGIWQGWVRRGEHSRVDRHFTQSSAILPQILDIGAPDPHHVFHGSTAFHVVHQDAACPPVVLLLGDSIDRFVVRDFCAAQNQSYEDWSGQTFRYRVDDISSATSVCRTPNGTLGHLHLFGTNSTGPYRDNINKNRYDPFVDTPLRICKGIEVFTRNVGKPVAIVFQAMMWDLLSFMKQEWLSDDSKVAVFRSSFLARIRDINRCRGHGTELVLRTVPKSRWAPNLAIALNWVIRNVSAELGLRLLDWDAEIRGWYLPKDPEGFIFRDAFHPTPNSCTIFAAEILALANRFCSTGSNISLGENREMDGVANEQVSLGAPSN